MSNKNLFSMTIAALTLVFSVGVSAQALYVAPSGNVGVGTITPGTAVEVIRSEAAGSFRLTSFTDASNQAPQFIQRRARGTSDIPVAIDAGDQLGLISFRGYTGSDFSSTKAAISAKTTENWTPSANGTQLTFATTPNGTTKKKNVMEITNDGKVKIKGTELWVPDYVFEEDYPLMPLDELSNYIAANKHLPGVATADDVHADGLDIASSQLSVLEKVEELTLYTLQQHEALKQQHEVLKQLDSLKAENASLKERLALMESRQVEMQAAMASLLENQQAESVLTSTAGGQTQMHLNRYNY